MRKLISATALVSILALLVPAWAASLPGIPDGVQWGESSQVLLDALGARVRIPGEVGRRFRNEVGH
jgi:hypothetical protein